MLKRLFERQARSLYPITAALALGVASATFGGAAQAVPITFTISDVSVSFSDVNNRNCNNNCDPEVVSYAPLSFELGEEGEVTDVDLFSLVFEGFGGQRPWGLGGGSVQASVTTDVLFSAPTRAQADPIFAYGKFVTSLFGKGTALEYFTQATDVTFGDGTVLSMSFPERKRRFDVSDTCKGPFCTVSLDVSTRATLEAIPEPGTIALLGVGLVGFGAMRHRRRSSARVASARVA